MTTIFELVTDFSHLVHPSKTFKFILNLIELFYKFLDGTPYFHEYLLLMLVYNSVISLPKVAIIAFLIWAARSWDRHSECFATIPFLTLHRLIKDIKKFEDRYDELREWINPDIIIILMILSLNFLKLYDFLRCFGLMALLVGPLEKRSIFSLRQFAHRIVEYMLRGFLDGKQGILTSLTCAEYAYGKQNMPQVVIFVCDPIIDENGQQFHPLTHIKCSSSNQECRFWQLSTNILAFKLID